MIGPPGVYGFGLLVLAIARSAVALAGLAAVDALLPGLGSGMPVGGWIVAVFEIVWIAPVGAVPVTVNAAMPPTARLSVVLIALPVPLAAPQALPGVAAQTQATPETAAGTVSA